MAQFRNAAYDKGAVDNIQLDDLSGKILQRFQRAALFTKVSATEPLAHITRTRRRGGGRLK